MRKSKVKKQEKRLLALQNKIIKRNRYLKRKGKPEKKVPTNM